MRPVPAHVANSVVGDGGRPRHPAMLTGLSRLVQLKPRGRLAEMSKSRLVSRTRLFSRRPSLGLKSSVSIWVSRVRSRSQSRFQDQTIGSALPGPESFVSVSVLAQRARSPNVWSHLTPLETGREERLENNPICDAWDVKLLLLHRSVADLSNCCVCNTSATNPRLFDRSTTSPHNKSR